MPEQEAVWCLVDGNGRPCMGWISRSEPTPSQKQDAVKHAERQYAVNKADPDYNPFSWHKYKLVPVREYQDDALFSPRKCGEQLKEMEL